MITVIRRHRVPNNIRPKHAQPLADWGRPSPARKMFADWIQEQCQLNPGTIPRSLNVVFIIVFGIQLDEILRAVKADPLLQLLRATLQ